MKSGLVFRSAAIGAICIILPAARAGTIQGTTSGSTVSAPALTADPNQRDDKDTATTIDVSFFSTCPFITNATNFPGFNFVFAALAPGNSATAPPVGMDVSPIDPSDFSISQYQPWVVDNHSPFNEIVAPSGTIVYQFVDDGGIPIQDAGGADIVISYLPKNGDPTSVNFVQAYREAFNGGAFTNGGILDSSGATPYYNTNTVPGATGTGSTDQPNTVPLAANATTAAWMTDQPADCETGDCSNPAGPDETRTSSTVVFQTFIEADQVCSADACGANKGTTYHVLYGGVQWGYTFTAVDAPEPSSVVLLAGFFAVGLLGRRLRRRA